MVHRMQTRSQSFHEVTSNQAEQSSSDRSVSPKNYDQVRSAHNDKKRQRDKSVEDLGPYTPKRAKAETPHAGMHSQIQETASMVIDRLLKKNAAENPFQSKDERSQQIRNDLIKWTKEPTAQFQTAIRDQLSIKDTVIVPRLDEHAANDVIGRVLGSQREKGASASNAEKDPKSGLPPN